MLISKCTAIEKEDKKRIKAEQKLQKKTIKAEASNTEASSSKSGLVKFAESIRGIIYIITGASIAVVLILGQTGAFITMSDIIENLMLATIGKFVLVVIAGALIIYGLKNIQLLK